MEMFAFVPICVEYNTVDCTMYINFSVVSFFNASTSILWREIFRKQRIYSTWFEIYTKYGHQTNEIRANGRGKIEYNTHTRTHIDNSKKIGRIFILKVDTKCKRLHFQKITDIFDNICASASKKIPYNFLRQKMAVLTLSSVQNFQHSKYRNYFLLGETEKTVLDISNLFYLQHGSASISTGSTVMTKVRYHLLSLAKWFVSHGVNHCASLPTFQYNINHSKWVIREEKNLQKRKWL